MKKAIGGLLALSLLLTACAIRQETVGRRMDICSTFLRRPMRPGAAI